MTCLVYEAALRIRPLSCLKQIIAVGKPAVKRLAYLPLGTARKRAKSIGQSSWALFKGYFYAKRRLMAPLQALVADRYQRASHYVNVTRPGPVF